MALRFVSEHKSWSDGLTWKVEIHDSDFVGSETEFFVQNGVDIEYRGDEDNLHWPILASTARFVMMVEDATHEQLITDMAGAKEGRFTVAIYKSGTFFWAGVINSPEISIVDNDFPYAFSITAVDGLALLKNYPCSQSGKRWDDVYEGQSKFITIISRCLKKVPHVVTHFTGSSKFLVTAINWYSDQSPTISATSDPFDHHYVDNRAFATGKASGAAAFLSCYDALVNILRAFNARISLTDGYFLIEQIEHRAATIGAPANYSRYYAYDLTGPTANTLTASQDIGRLESIKKGAGGTYSFVPALQKVRATQTLNALQNLIPAAQFSSDAPATYTVGWVKGQGLGSYMRFTCTIEWELENVGLPANVTLYGVFRLLLSLDSLYATRTVTLSSSGTYSESAITWGASLDYIDIPVKMELAAATETWSGTSSVDLFFRTDSTFTYGDLQVSIDFDYLWFSGNGFGTADPADYNLEWVVKDAYATIQKSRTSFAPKTVTYEVTGNSDNTQVYETSSIIGDLDGDIINQWGGILAFDSPDYVYTTLWANRSGTPVRPITQLCAERILASMYTPRKVLRTTAIGNTFSIQVPVADNGSDVYILKNGKYNTDRDEMTGEWVRLSYSSDTITYADAEYDTGTYEATQPGGGGSSGGGGNVDNGGGGTGGGTGGGLPSTVQGDILYASAANTIVTLAKDTNATRYLSNTGTSNNPAWAQINLANGVTGDLPFANLTQIAGLSVLGVTGNSTADVAAITAALDGQVLRRSGTSLAFGAVNLASTNAVTGTLPVGNGGTGAATFTANRVLLGNGTSAITTSANLTFNTSTNRLAAGLSSSTTAGVDLNGYTTSTLGSPVLTATFRQMRFFGTPSTATNNVVYQPLYIGATISNNGTPTGGSNQGLVVETSVSSPTRLSNYSGGVFTVSSTSSNVDVLYGLRTAITDWTTGASLDNRTAMSFDCLKRGDAVDIHTGRGVQGRVLDLSTSGRWNSGVAADFQVQQALTGRALLGGVFNSRGTGNTQYGTDITLTTSGSGVTSTNVYGHNITITASSSGAITTAYGIRLTSGLTGITTAYFLYNSTNWRNYLNGSLALGVDDTGAKLFVRGTGATSSTVTAIFENSSGTDILYVRDDGRVSIGNSSPQQTLHVTGTMRLTGSDGTATALMGRDADGDISGVTVGGTLSLSGNVLSDTGSNVISPAQLTSNQNDWNPTGLSTAGVIRLSGDNGFRIISGLAGTGRYLWHNVGSFALMLATDDNNSTAANRFSFGRHVVLFPGKTIETYYDATTQRHRLVAQGGIYDDVQQYYLNHVFTAPVSTTAGDFDFWNIVSAGTATSVAPVAGRWSGVGVNTGTSTTGLGHVSSKAVFANLNLTAGTATAAYFKCVIRTPSALSDATDNYTIRVGLIGTTGGGGTSDGFYFRYNHASKSGQLAPTATTGGSESSTTSGTTLAASTTYVLEGMYRPDGICAYAINGSWVVTIAAILTPTNDNVMCVAEIVKSAGTNSREITIYTLQTSIFLVA